MEDKNAGKVVLEAEIALAKKRQKYVRRKSDTVLTPSGIIQKFKKAYILKIKLMDHLKYKFNISLKPHFTEFHF